MDSRVAHRPLTAAKVSSITDVLSRNGPPNALQGVVVPVDHTLFELDDGVIGDLDACGADFGAASVSYTHLTLPTKA